MRAAGVAPSQRADLAADVARLERRLADLTRERDGAHQLALATATERDRLRAQLDAQPAHRAAGDGVDLARYVLRSEVVAALLSDALDSELVSKLHTSGAARDALRSCARTTRGLAARFRGDLRSEAVEGGEQKAVEGAGGHGASVATGSATGKAHVG